MTDLERYQITQLMEKVAELEKALQPALVFGVFAFLGVLMLGAFIFVKYCVRDSSDK